MTWTQSDLYWGQQRKGNKAGRKALMCVSLLKRKKARAEFLSRSTAQCFASVGKLTAKPLVEVLYICCWCEPVDWLLVGATKMVQRTNRLHTAQCDAHIYLTCRRSKQLFASYGCHHVRLSFYPSHDFITTSCRNKGGLADARVCSLRWCGRETTGLTQALYERDLMISSKCAPWLFSQSWQCVTFKAVWGKILMKPAILIVHTAAQVICTKAVHLLNCKTRAIECRW